MYEIILVITTIWFIFALAQFFFLFAIPFQMVAIFLQVIIPPSSNGRRVIVGIWVKVEKGASGVYRSLPKWAGQSMVLGLSPFYWFLFECDSGEFWHFVLHWDWCSPNHAIRSELFGRQRLFSSTTLF